MSALTLGDEVAGELAIHNPVDRINAEDLTSNKSSLELIDELVVPLHDLGVSMLCLEGRLGGIHVAVLDHDPHALESIADNATLGRTDDVELLAEDQDSQTGAEHAEAEKIGGPEADIPLHVGSGQERQTAEVDAKVEDHVDALDGDGRIQDDALSRRKSGKGHLTALVLICNQRSDVGLDTTGTQANDDDGGNEATQTSSMLQGDRQRGQEQDQKTDDVDDAEENDGEVLSKVLVGNDGAQNWGDWSSQRTDKKGKNTV